MSVPLGRCYSCHTPVRWALTEKGKRIPLDPDPSPEGTYYLSPLGDDQDVAHFWKPVGRECPPDVLYVVHFVTCPDGGKTGKDVSRRALQRTLFKGREGL